MIRRPPLQARSVGRLRKLLDVSRELVLEHGREYVTTAMIAEGAGASIGTVYRYFDDIHEILDVVQPIHRHGVTAVLELHKITQPDSDEPWCSHDYKAWPCETIRALIEGVAE